MATAAPLDIVDTRPGEHLVEHSIRSLFDGDGTIYLVTGFFTENAYRSIESDIAAFLDRDPANELVVMANPTADQFSKHIVQDLRSLDVAGSVRLLQYPDRFLHAKLYVRDGPEPMAILGSANLTRGAFEYNLEVGVVIEADDPGDPSVDPFIDWVQTLAAESVPITRRDLFFPIRVSRSVSNWVNKGRLISPRLAAGRATPVLLVIVGLLALTHWL